MPATFRTLKRNELNRKKKRDGRKRKEHKEREAMFGVTRETRREDAAAGLLL